MVAIVVLHVPEYKRMPFRQIPLALGPMKLTDARATTIGDLQRHLEMKGLKGSITRVVAIGEVRRSSPKRSRARRE